MARADALVVTFLVNALWQVPLVAAVAAAAAAVLLALLERRPRPAAGRLLVASGTLGVLLAAAAASGWSVAVAASDERSDTRPTASVADRILSALQEAPRPGDFSYDAAGRRDPFVNVKAERPHPGEVAGPPGFAIEDVALRGIVATTRGRIAMIVGPDGKSYFVSPGQPFFDGALVSIDGSGLTFRKEQVNAAGRTEVHELRMSLHPGDEAAGPRP